MCRRSNQHFAPIYLFLPTRNKESSYNFPVILIFCKQRFNKARVIMFSYDGENGTVLERATERTRNLSTHRNTQVVTTLKSCTFYG
jgi:hypothetical protein